METHLYQPNRDLVYRNGDELLVIGGFCLRFVGPRRDEGLPPGQVESSTSQVFQKGQKRPEGTIQSARISGSLDTVTLYNAHNAHNA